MAEVDLSGVTTFPHAQTITLSATPGNVRRVLFPLGADYTISFYPDATAIKFVDGGVVLADEAAIGGSRYVTIEAGGWSEMRFVGRKLGTYFSLASAAVSPTVRILLERVHK